MSERNWAQEYEELAKSHAQLQHRLDDLLQQQADERQAVQAKHEQALRELKTDLEAKLDAERKRLRDQYLAEKHARELERLQHQHEMERQQG